MRRALVVVVDVCAPLHQVARDLHGAALDAQQQGGVAVNVLVFQHLENNHDFQPFLLFLHF